MDLLATVRKEGSRGGRGEFKWTDVQNSSHRENYLGHSVMAPVGRWQKGRDLNWYAKDEPGADGENAADKAARERKEEIRRIKEAEQDAMAKALGLPVPDRSNANLQEVSQKRNMNEALKEVISDEVGNSAKGVGYSGASRSANPNAQIMGERIEGNAEGQDRELRYALKEYRRRHGDRDREQRQRSRSPDRHRQHYERDRAREKDRHKRHDDIPKDRHRHRRRHSRSRSRSRSRERNRNKEYDAGDRNRGRNRSPYRRDDNRIERKR